MKKIWILSVLFTLAISFTLFEWKAPRSPASGSLLGRCTELIAPFFNRRSSKLSHHFSLTKLTTLNTPKFDNYLDVYTNFFQYAITHPDKSKGDILATFFPIEEFHVTTETLQAITRVFFSEDDLADFNKALLRNKERLIRNNSNFYNDPTYLNISNFLKSEIELSFNHSLDSSLPLYDQVRAILSSPDVSEEMKYALQVLNIALTSGTYHKAPIPYVSSKRYIFSQYYSYILYSSMSHLTEEEIDTLKYLVMRGVDRAITENGHSHMMGGETLYRLLHKDDIKRLSPYLTSNDLQQYLLSKFDKSPGPYAGLQHPYISEFKRGVLWMRTEEERASYLLTVGADGKLYDHQGNLFDTEYGHAFHSKGKPRAIFVISKDGKIYQNNLPERHRFHHSSFMAGEDVAFAGEIEVRDGVIYAISGESGHYLPKSKHFENVHDFLRENNIPAEQISFELFLE